MPKRKAAVNERLQAEERTREHQAQLEQRINEHRQSEERLKGYREQLEQQVQESTAKLVAANEEIQNIDQMQLAERTTTNF
jgi:hypothetical protein